MVGAKRFPLEILLGTAAEHKVTLIERALRTVSVSGKAAARDRTQNAVRLIY